MSPGAIGAGLSGSSASNVSSGDPNGCEHKVSVLSAAKLLQKLPPIVQWRLAVMRRENPRASSRQLRQMLVDARVYTDLGCAPSTSTIARMIKKCDARWNKYKNGCIFKVSSN